LNTFSEYFEKCIIIDANFILIPVQFKIDYLEDINFDLEGKKVFIIFQQVLNELKAKKKRDSKASKFELQLKAGLAYLDKKKDAYCIKWDATVKNQEETTDNFLLRKAIEFKSHYKAVYIASNDADLRRKAKKSNIYSIFLRQRKYLSYD